MLQDDVIESATTEREMTILFYFKKDDSLQICFDHPKHNAVTIRDSYRLFWMDAFIDLLAKPTRIMTWDYNFGYWNIEVDERDHERPSL